MLNNIEKNHTLSEYNKKYYKRKYCLLSYTKKEIINFVKKYNCSKEFILKNHKWWLINDTYYEVPRFLSITWFNNLNVFIKALICLFCVSLVSTSIALPIILNSRNIIDNNEIGFDNESTNILESTNFIKKDNKYIITLKTKDKTKLPIVTNIKKGDKTFKFDFDYSYSLENNELIINCPNNETINNEKIIVSVMAEDKQWFNDKEYINSLTTNDIGLIKEVKVNGLYHKVRLIDVDHDIDENSNKFHTTWEFNNIISDDLGFSLGYQWHDNNDPPNSNNDFPNSSIRKALTGQGNFSSTVYCSTRNSLDKWDSKYTDITVLDMLEPSFKYSIKKVKKEVRTGPTKDIITNYSDRLFMLSSKEIGYSYETKSTGETYKYYINPTYEKCVKKQVNNVVYTDYPIINTKETLWKGLVYNFAGYNRTSENNGGGYYWLCAPRSDYSYDVIYCNSLGTIWHGSYAYIKAYGIAPAFCL